MEETKVVCNNGKAGPGNKPAKKANPVVVESSSESTTDSDHWVKTINSGDNYLGTNDAFNTECIGMSHNDYAADKKREENRFIGEEELLGSRIEVHSIESASTRNSKSEDQINDLEQDLTLENSKLKTGPSGTDTVGISLSEAMVNGGSDVVNLGHNRAMEDVGFMGFKNTELINEEADIEMVEEPHLFGPSRIKTTWADRVHSLNNPLGNIERVKGVDGVLIPGERSNRRDKDLAKTLWIVTNVATLCHVVSVWITPPVGIFQVNVEDAFKAVATSGGVS
ncbi:hypothetical protein V6N11_039448 [Hibiscus sabdariffa]|uniref:Uncharacterized protein n=1 Tax=Hibiscus sabdariffa TaxID=183260 RepID=A0ABR2SMW0_9ROSI